MNAYKVLDIPRNATKEEIRVAYKKMALKWHPDRHTANNKENANQKFIEVHNAYKALTVRKERRRAQQTTSSEKNTECHDASYSCSHTSNNPSTKSSVSSASEECSSGNPPAFATSDSRSSTRSSPNFTSPPMSHSKSFGYYTNSQSSSNQHTPTHSDEYTTGTSSTPSESCNSSDQSSSDTTPPHSPKSARTIPVEHQKPQGPIHQKPTRAAKLRKRSKPRQEQKPTSNKRKTDPTTAPEIPNKFPKTDSDDFILVPPLGKDDRGDKVAKFTIKFTLEELFHGARHRYRLKRHFLSGKRKNIVFDVVIPPGCRPGSRVLFHNTGNELKDGALQDVVFVIEEAPHERFQRVKDDLITDVRLPWVKSMQDDKTQIIPLEGLDGQSFHLVIDYPTDKTMEGSHVVAGAGMPVRRNGEVVGRGDLIVRWEIVPSSSSKWGALKKALHIET